MKKTIVTAVVVLLAVTVLGASRCSDNDATAQNSSAAAGKKPQEGEISVSNPIKGDKPQSEMGLSPPLDDRLANANRQFGLRLFAALRESGEGAEDNLFISPLSVSIALAMAYNGAAGQTALSMARALGFDGLDTTELNAAMRDLVTALENPDSLVEISIANSLWGRRGFSFSNAFLDKTGTYYEAEITTLDFDSPDAPDTINRWVNDATRGMIDNIVDRIPPEIVLHLINAIYFKGQWQTEFDPARTHDWDFDTAAGGTATVSMMSHSGSYRHLAGDGFQAVRLPYGDGNLAMYVFLPDETGGLGELLADLDEETWRQRFQGFRPKDGDVMLPRFRIEYLSLLNSALSGMGMGIAFDGGRADFSGMTTTGADLYISSVVHKAVVEVNEEGTEAAAVTDIAIGVTSIQPEEERFRFVADHPFFFVIRDDRTDSILFMGILNDPKG